MNLYVSVMRILDYQFDSAGWLVYQLFQEPLLEFRDFVIVDLVLRVPWWKSRYQGANFCQDLEVSPRKAWQKFVPWYLLFHMMMSLRQ